MKTAYLDAFSGLSGDMIVGAILDCGADFGEFERAIKSMPLAGYRLSTRRKTLSGISALKFDVEVTRAATGASLRRDSRADRRVAAGRHGQASRDLNLRSARAGRGEDS